MSNEEAATRGVKMEALMTEAPSYGIEADVGSILISRVLHLRSSENISSPRLQIHRHSTSKRAHCGQVHEDRLTAICSLLLRLRNAST